VHNMRTLSYLAEDKQQEIAQETLDIYAPLAHRLGIYWLKSELEDLALRALQPEVYNQLKQDVAKKKTERERYIAEVIAILQQKLAEGGDEGRGPWPAQAFLFDLPENAGAEPALQPDL
jgi:Guanosine polyphosphate pyrophosphohydrolases/synthetases